MTTTLDNYQFELLPDETATEGIVFGIGSGGVDMEDGGFIPGDDDWATDDQQDQFNGGMRMGNDVLNGPSHGFNLFVNVDDEPGALTALRAFRTAWRAWSVRKSPGALTVCRFRLNDEYRRFYGRPRRFSAPPSNLIQKGYVPVTTDFQAVDGFFYDDTENTESITMRDFTGDSDGGFVFDRTTGIEFPAIALPVGSGLSNFTVGGDATAYPIITIQGPVTNPRVETDAWTIQLTIALAADDVVVIDTRPWKRTAILNGSGSVGGALSGYFSGQRHQSIADAVLEPGPAGVTFWGTSASGSPTCTIRWRNTYNSY